MFENGTKARSITHISRRAGSVIVACTVALVAAIPYLVGGVGRSFINLDDPEYVTKNDQVLAGLTAAGVRWAWSSFHSANWHPLTWMSHMLDVSLFGVQPFWHHLTNIAFHALTAALLFLALRRMTGALWPSALVAALFGVHPLHVETVAWVAERKDVLSGLCFAFVLLAYERYVRRKGPARYLAVLALLALGLTAKPMLVTMPFVLLLLDFWPLGRTRLAPPADGSVWRPRRLAGLIVEKLPLLTLSIASSVVTYRAQEAYNAISAPGAIPAGLRVANALVSTVGYIGKTLWPTSLAVYYPYPAEAHPWWKVAGAMFVLIAATAAVLALLRRRPGLAVGWFWYLGMLVPVIGLVQVGQQAMADRYTYLPQTGLFLLATWGLPALVRPFRQRSVLMRAGSVLVVALLAMTSIQQVRYWRDGIALFTHTLAVTTGNWVIHNNLGITLAEQGRYAEAAEHYREAIRLGPRLARSHVNLALVLVKMGQPQAAVAQFREALRLQPDLIKRGIIGLSLPGK